MNLKFVFILFLWIIGFDILPQSTFWQKIKSPSTEEMKCPIRVPWGRIVIGTQSEGIRISNNGIDWQHFCNSGFSYFYDILWGPDNNLYVSEFQTILVYNQAGYGVFSKNLNTTAWDLAVSSQSHLYAATADSGLIRTTDNGITWDMNILLPDSDLIFSSVAIDQSDNIFVGSFNGVYLSTNNGHVWNNIGLNNEQIRNITVTSNDYIFAQSSSRVYRLTSIGAQWQLVVNGIPNGTGIHQIVEAEDGNLFLGEWGFAQHGAIFRSTNFGDHWDNIFETNMYLTGILPFQNKILLTTTSGSYIADMTDSSLISITIVDDDEVRNFVRNNNGDMYAYCISQYGQPEWLISTNFGQLWRRYGIDDGIVKMWYYNITDVQLAGGYGNAGVIVNRVPYINWILEGTSFNLMSSMVYDIESNLVFISTNEKTYGSYVPGEIFKGELSTGTTEFNKCINMLPQHRNINMLALNSSGWIFAGLDSGVYRSTDQGNTWHILNNGIAGPGIDFIEVDSKDNVFAVTTDGKFYRSEDNGNNWQGTAQFGWTTRDLIIDREDNIYIADYNKVYISIDSGYTFAILGEVISVYDWLMGIFIDQGGYRYVYGRSGIYTSSEPVTSTGEFMETAPDKLLLSQNYPNPFNPDTRISYSIPKYSFVTIKIFDILGNEIETLVNQEKPRGTYEMTWNASKLPSGVYFYRIQAENISETRKMILMK